MKDENEDDDSLLKELEEYLDTYYVNQVLNSLNDYYISLAKTI